MLWLSLFVYCVLIAIASLAGGWLPSLIQMTHLRKQLLMSFVSGVMLGVALLHMLPLAAGPLQSSAWLGGSVMCGMLVMFFLIRVFHAHPHEEAAHDHEQDHEHEHDHAHEAPTKKAPAVASDESKRAGWTGLFIGMTIHSLLDGAALSLSMRVEAESHEGWTLVGLGTFAAIFLHKPLDALAVTSLMHASDWSPKARGLANGLFALTSPIGAVVFWLGADQLMGDQGFPLGIAMGFAAGFFICIALADLLPEVAFHSHDRGKLSFALLLGVALACAVELMHSHDHTEASAQPGHSHGGDVHSH